VVKHTDAEGGPIRGERTVNEVQAEIVRRVFHAFAAGISPRAIARRLNGEGIPAPTVRCGQTPPCAVTPRAAPGSSTTHSNIGKLV
jgi:hypothetical protein